MRYRIVFTAKKDMDFNWESSDVIETDDLLSLIFQFQIAVAKEFKKIIEASQRMTNHDNANDEIPF